MNFFRSLGPAIAHASPREALRAGAGALVGLGVAGLFLLSPNADLDLGLYLIAPFGATSVLIFAVPNSPLAQPWSAIVGNTVAALVGVATCMLVAEPTLRIAMAVGLAVAATILCRAVHPPAGAVAMTAAMSPSAIDHLGFWFALMPVAAGTIVLVAIAAVYAHLTGRHYPFRQFEAPAAARGEDRKPAGWPILSEEALTGLLERNRQSFNLGVEDLARLISAAELQVAAQRTGELSASDIMSRTLVTVDPATPLAQVADLFRQYRFASLPVVGKGDRYLGVIFQINLISRAREDALRLERNFLPAFGRLLDRSRNKPVLAGDIMNVAGPRATTQTPIGALLPMMADKDVDAVPVLERGRIVGIVTRTDLVVALAHLVIRGE
ncbi:HPP family protein [Chachezhania sediminis]|uniref:HPP family protein n=1 Tax=Chachezhania sediminis TaxID=2599291 RepID=UPI00131DC6C5|nr:HPP family protein [Chachezhania sediminis]